MAFSFVGRIGAFRKSNPWCNQPGPRHPSPTSPQCSPGAAVLSLGHRPLGLTVPYSCPALHHIAGSPVWAQSSPTPAGLPWAAWQRGLWRFVFVPSPLTPPGLSSQPKYCVIHLLTNRCLGPSQNGSSRRQEAGGGALIQFEEPRSAFLVNTMNTWVENYVNTSQLVSSV